MNLTGKRLRELREAKGLSQNEVAKLLGISRTAYVKYETGESRPVRKIKELSQLFNVSTDYILANNEPATPHAEKMPKDLNKFLEQTEIVFNGDTYNLNDEEKAMIMKSLEVAFYAAKQANKRKKDDPQKK